MQTGKLLYQEHNKRQDRNVTWRMRLLGDIKRKAFLKRIKIKRLKNLKNLVVFTFFRCINFDGQYNETRAQMLETMFNYNREESDCTIRSTCPFSFQHNEI